MKISIEGLALIKKFEGLELEAYRCAAGVLTIGYGHTKGVTEGQKITKAEADELLVHELVEYEKAVNDAVTISIDQCMFDALLSRTYKLGPSNLNASTMLKVLNGGDYDGVPAQIKRWNKAGGKVLDGLIRRRTAEALLFEGQDWSEI